MSEVIFVYNENPISIQAQSNEILSTVIERFCTKANANKNNVFFYIMVEY